MRQIRFTFLALIALLAGCAPAANPSPSPSPAPATQSGGAAPAATTQTEHRSANQKFTIAQVGLPANLSPAASASNYAVYSTLYDALVQLDAQSDALPWAAEKWSQVDPTTWRFTLRKGMVFTDGKPVTAADVEFTINTIIQNKFPQIGGLGTLTGAKMVDDYTVDLTTKVPDASMLPGLVNCWIMPKHYYEQVGKDGFAAKPMGSGPYELVEYRAGDLAHMRKKTAEHPFRKASPTELVFRSIPEGTAMVAGFRTGDLDVLIGQISADQVQLLKGNGVNIDVRFPGVNYALYDMPSFNDRNTPLKDKRVRIALQYAIDRETLAKTVYQGYAKPVSQFSVPGALSFNPSLKEYTYDPALAKKLLAEAGYPNGFTLPAGIEYTPQTTSPQLAVAIQAYLHEVGVEAPVTQLELAVFLDKYYGRNNQVRGDLFMVTTQTSNAFSSNQFSNMGCERGWWCNQEFDSLREQVIAEPDKAKRGALLQKAIKLLYDDVATLNTLAVPEFVIQQPKLRGFTWKAPSTHNFETLYRID